MSMVPSQQAQQYWAFIQKYFLTGTNTPIADLTNYTTSTIGQASTVKNGGFTYPSLNIAPNNCPYKCPSYSAATQNAPNTFCYDSLGKCNDYANFLMFQSMIAEITGEFSCASIGNGCPVSPAQQASAGGATSFWSLAANQTTFYNILRPVNTVFTATFPAAANLAISNNDPSWNIGLDPVSGVQSVFAFDSGSQKGVISQLNAMLSNASISIPFGLNLPLN